MITLETLEKWLNAPAETENLEFKEAKSQLLPRDGYLLFSCATPPRWRLYELFVY